jgi:PncC family amidohydrolase
MLGDLLSRNRNPMLGTTVAAGIVSVRVRSEFPQLDQARRELDSACAAVERCLGSLVFGQENATLADTVGAMLRSEGLTLTTAESCTGGLIGTMLTDAPGASLYYHGGWVTYANDAKVEQLGVDAALLENHGAVSEQVARAMADGALARSDADLAISVTGIAGPDGGTDEKPVGTVWFGLAQTDRPTLAQRHVFPGDRSIIRERAAHHALNLVRLRLLGEL